MNNPSASALETACNLELHNLYKWCNAHKLQIYPQKSAVLTILFKLSSPKLDSNINYIMQARYHAMNLAIILECILILKCSLKPILN